MPITASRLKEIRIFAIMDRMRINPNSSGSTRLRQAGVFTPLSCSSKQRGFTLIEVMIVIIIIGVVSALGIPAFSEWRSQQAVRSAAQALYGQMKQARVQALAENRNVSVEFCDGTVRTGWVFDAASPDATCDPCTTLNCVENLLSLTQFSASLTLATNKDTITFYSRGTAINGTVTLSAGNSSQQVVVNIIGRAYTQ